MAVRTVCLHRGRVTGPAASQPLRCPVDQTIIVKHIVLSSINSPAPHVQVYTQSPGSTVFALLLETTLTTRTPVTWQGWLVMNDDDTLQLHADSSHFDFWISGTLLSGEVPWTPPAQGSTQDFPDDVRSGETKPARRSRKP